MALSLLGGNSRGREEGFPVITHVDCELYHCCPPSAQHSSRPAAGTPSWVVEENDSERAVTAWGEVGTHTCWHSVQYVVCRVCMHRVLL